MGTIAKEIFPGHYAIKDESGYELMVLAASSEVDAISKFNEFINQTSEPYQQSLAEAKAVKLQEINNWADDQLKPILTQYPEAEVKSWPEQKAEATQWLADNTAETPLIDSMAARRGIDKAELIRRIMIKVKVYAETSGEVFGDRQAFEDQLEAATTREAVEAIILPD